MLTSDHIDMLLTVIDKGSFSAAARALGLPVVVVDRPPVPPIPVVATAADAVAWLARATTLPVEHRS